MKRRVEIVRAIMADSDIVVMDEPFAGLDDTTKNKVIGYIMDNIGDRILIISTHDYRMQKNFVRMCFLWIRKKLHIAIA